MDAFDALDKALLDQDSDGVSVDSDDGQVQLRSIAQAGRAANSHDDPDIDGAFPGTGSTKAGAGAGGESTSIRLGVNGYALFEPGHRTASMPYRPKFLQGFSSNATPTPISSLTSYLEGLFADGHGEAMPYRPKRLIAVSDGHGNEDGHDGSEGLLDYKSDSALPDNAQDKAKRGGAVGRARAAGGGGGRVASAKDTQADSEEENEEEDDAMRWVNIYVRMGDSKMRRGHRFLLLCAEHVN